MTCPGCNAELGEDGSCPNCGPPSMLDVPTVDLVRMLVQDRFRVGQLIARGGMSEVFEGYDLSLKRPVAVKFLAPRFQSDPELRKRFQHEAEALAALEHPNIVPVHAVGEHQGLPFMVMKLLRGRSLDQLIRTAGPLDLGEVVHVGEQVCEALRLIHSRGRVHRDIKPANLIVDPDGHTTLLDFGIMRNEEVAITRAGAVVGTPEFMAPEQGRDARLADARSDLYSLGATLYAALTGTPPFAGDTPFDLLSKHLREAPRPPSEVRPGIASETDRFFERAMAKKASDRFASAAEMSDALRRLAEPTWTQRTAAVDPPGVDASVEQGTARPAPKVAFWRRRTARILIIGAPLAVIASLLLLTLPRRNTTSGEARGPRPAAAGHVSIAVLPFRNLTGDKAQEFFAEGLSDGLISELSQVRAIRVISRTSVARYKDRRAPLPLVARRLDVDTVVEGALSRVGHRVGLSIRLVDARADRQLWVKRYERRAREVLDLQAEIARDLTEKLGVRLTRVERHRLARARRVDPQAHRHYLRGRYWMFKFASDGVHRALASFRRALDIDPAYAPAYAGIALGYSILGAFGPLRPAEAFVKCKAAARRALALDETLADAHVAMALANLLYDWDWTAAGKSLRRALALRPGDGMIHHVYSSYLLYRGRLHESYRAAARAVRLDPLSASNVCQQGWVRHSQGRDDDALRIAQEALELDPRFYVAHWLKGAALAEKGQLAEAIAALEVAVRFSRRAPLVVAALGAVEARAGHRARARALLRELVARAKQEFVPPFGNAVIYAALGERQQAIAALERSAKSRDSRFPLLPVEPFLASVRDDPGLKRLYQRLILEQTAPIKKGSPSSQTLIAPGREPP